MSTSNAQAPNTATAVDDEPMVVWSINRAQKEFLSARLHDYKTAFVSKSLDAFWITFYRDWFAKWPAAPNFVTFVEEQLRAWLLSNSKWVPTPAQRTFLQANIPDYKSAQEAKALYDFWPRLFAHWFNHWPATEIAPQDVVEKKLKAWFNNNARVSANARQVLDLQTPVKRSRRPTEAQVFCKVYWHRAVNAEGDTLSQIVKRDWVIEWKNREDYDPNVPRPTHPPNFMNEVAAAIYALQPSSVVEEIKAHPDRQKKKTSAAEGEDDSPEVAHARDLAASIVRLPYSLQQAGKQILQKAGFVSFQMVAGPDPSQGGNIAVYSFTEGRISSGCDFLQFSGGLRTEMQTKFGEFARMVFPPDVRVRRSLPGTEGLRNYEVPSIPALRASASAPLLATSSASEAPLLPPVSSELDIHQEDNDSDVEIMSEKTIAPSEKPILQPPSRASVTPTAEADAAVGNAHSPDLSPANMPLALPSADMDTTEVSLTPTSVTQALVDVGSASTTSTPVSGDVTAEDNVTMTAPTPETIGSHDEADGSHCESVGSHDEAVGSHNEAADISFLAPVIDDAPEWLRTAVKHLAGLSSDTRWKSILKYFVAFEQNLGFLEGKITTNMLAPGKHRPKEVGAWIKSGRVGNPTLKNPVDFGARWWSWYTELQPQSRKATPGNLQRIAPINGEWTELRKGTVNGVYALLASLGWWIQADKVHGRSKVEIELALSDFTWALDAMARGGNDKRASPDADDRVAKKARVV